MEKRLLNYLADLHCLLSEETTNDRSQYGLSVTLEDHKAISDCQCDIAKDYRNLKQKIRENI